MQTYLVKVNGQQRYSHSEKDNAMQITKQYISIGQEAKLFLLSVTEVEVPLKPDVPPAMPKE